MAIDDPKGGAEPGGFLGFQTYADGTPRGFDPAEDSEPRPGGWDTPPPFAPDAPAPRRGPGMMIAAGAAVLAAFGGGYLVARSDPPPAGAPSPASEAVAMAAARPMNVEVAEAAPPPVPPPGREKLEVLPRDTPPASVAPRAATPMAVPPLVLRPPPPARAEAPPARDAAAVETAPAAAPPPPTRASFDCRDAPTPARAMVCRDAGLARMDQRMKQAYAAAVAAGAPEDELAADQQDWLAIREEAARYSRRSVANIYRQRIDELESMGGRGWR